MLESLDYGAAFGGDYLYLFMSGVGNTVALFLSCWVCALLLAATLSVIRTVPSRLTRAACVAYVEYHRNVPVLVQILAWYFAIPQMLPDGVSAYLNRHNSEALYSAIALILFSCAYMSEDIRSGLRAIPRGQYEAARSIGMGHLRAMRLIILPQAIRLSAVPLVNQALILFKATSLASAIGVAELTFETLQIESQTFRIFEAFSAATLVYLTISLTIMFVGELVGKRVALNRK